MKMRFEHGLFRILLALALVLFVPLSAMADVLVNANEGAVYITGTTDADGNAKVVLSQEEKTADVTGTGIAITSDYSWDYGSLGSPYFGNSPSSNAWESPVFVDTDTDLTIEIAGGTYIPYEYADVNDEEDNGGATYVPMTVNTSRGATVTLVLYDDTYMVGGADAVVLRHPASVATVKKFIAELI